MSQLSAEPASFSPEFERYVDPAGHEFQFVRVRHENSRGLGIHFSAFFGAWGNKKRTRENFKGYFHRLRMLGTCPDHDWLFLCDTYGFIENGTYYTGKAGDLFVERAMLAIIAEEMRHRDHGYDQVVTVGSSMGGTGALTVGLHLGVAGVVTVCPHIDLDICALQCTKYPEVAFACPDGDPGSPTNFGITRRIGMLLDRTSPEHPPPALFVQSVADDAGVHHEQVLPLVDRWRQHGGKVYLDVRPTGGHTSDFAPRALLLDAIDRMLEREPIDPGTYQRDPRFQGQPSHLTRGEVIIQSVREKLTLRRRLKTVKGALHIRSTRTRPD